MTTMIVELYDALKDAGATEEKARRAAESVAAYGTRFTDVQQSITTFPGEMNQGFASLRADINILKWMGGANLALTFAVFIKLFVP